MSKIINIIRRVSIKKRIILFTLLIVISIVGINAYRSINTFTEQLENNQKEDLIKEINLVNNILEEKIKGHGERAQILSQLSEVNDLIKDEFLLTNPLLEIMLNMELGGVSLRNRDMELVYSIGETDGLKSQTKLAESLKEVVLKNETAVYFMQNTLGVQMNSINSVVDEFDSVIGSVVVNEPMNISFVNEIAQNTGSVVQIYKEEDLMFVNEGKTSFDEKNLLDEDVVSKFKEDDLEYFIKPKIIDGNPYLIGYMSFKNHFNEPIAYLALIKEQTKIYETVTNVIKENIFISISMIILATLIILLIVESINKPLRNVISKIKQIEEGDLDIQLDTKYKDEVGSLTSSFGNMTSQLKNMITEIRNSSFSLNSSSDSIIEVSKFIDQSSNQVSSAIQQVAEGAEEQAKQTEDVNTQMQGLDKQLETIQNVGDEVKEYNKNMKQKTVEGQEKINLVTEQMKKIKKSIEEVANKIDNLEGITSEIDNITVIINNIAEQTNLLALNAAIEAARAGEAGRGFAVVADEIRSLAEESSNSAEQIRNLIKKVKEESNSVSQKMNIGNQQIEKGEDVVFLAKEAFDKIKDTINQVNEGVETFNHAIIKAHKDSKSIAANMIDIASISEETSASSEEVLSLSQEQNVLSADILNMAKNLSEISSKQRKLIERFVFEEDE
ncbi:MAG: methyl-accepting chemotaxis protein [Candidatus Woesearchaeota archaeon]